VIEKIGLGIILDASNKMSGKADEASRSLDNLRKRGKKTADGVVGDTDRMTAALSRYARGFTVGFKLAALGAAVEAPLIGMATLAARTEHTFSELRSLIVNTGLSTEEMNSKIFNLQRRVYDVAANTIMNYQDLLLGLYPLASKFGIDIATQLFEPVQVLAIAGKGTMLDAVRVMNQLFDTFGPNMNIADPAERASKIINILAGTIKLYDTDLTRLVESLKYATPLSVQLGLSLEETASIVGALTGTMVEGSKAGTAYESFLRGVIQFTRRLSDSTEQSNMSIEDFIKVSEGGLLGKSGGRLLDNPLSKIRFADPTTGRIRPMLDIIDEIAKMFNIKSETDIATLEQNQALMEAFQSEGVRAIGILIRTSDKVKKHTEAIRKNNDAYDMYNEISRDTYGNFMRLWNATKVLSSEIGSNLLKDVDSLIRLMDKFRIAILNWAKTNPQMTIWASRAAMATGAMFILAGSITVFTFAIKTAREAIEIILKQLGWLVKIISYLGNTVAGLWVRLQLLALWTKVAAGATWLFNAALLANPIVWVVAGVVALVAGLVLLIKHWDWLRERLIKIRYMFLKILDIIPDFMLVLFPVFLIIKHFDTLISGFKKIFDIISRIFGGFVDWITGKVNMLSLVMSSIWIILKETIRSTWNEIKWIIKGVITSIIGDPGFQALIKAVDWLSGIRHSMLSSIGWYDTPPPTKYDWWLPAPAGAGAGVGAATMPSNIVQGLPPAGSVSTDYSIHRNVINIYEVANPSDTAKAVDSILRPDGEF